MDIEVVKKFRDIAESKNLNMEIMFDNVEYLNTKLQGTIVNFDDEHELVVYTRINDSPTQMFIGPYEFGCRPYSDIQRITIQASAKDVNRIIDECPELCGKKAADMKEFVSTCTAANTYHATPSVDDVTNRVGTKPQVYSTNQYGSAGENRAANSKPVSKTPIIKLGVDGSVPADANIPKPLVPNNDI